jgi:hypothetical protein
MRTFAVCLALACARVAAAQGPAPAQPSTGEPAPAQPSADELKEIEKALAADQAAKAKAGASAAAPATSTPAGASAASGTVTGGGRSGALGRFFQSLNPDVSAIVTFAGGYYSDDDHTVKSGDDPAHTGFNVQEVELALQAVVDPYFRADVFLTIPNLQGLEVEEAFLTTTNLPANLQLKAGIFRAGLGRQNTQHLHVQDFARRPLLNPTLLGPDGLRAPGMELNWLVPRLPFYLLLAFSAFSVSPADPDMGLQTFGGGQRWNFTYVGSARAFFPFNDTTSLYLGLNYAHGKSSERVTENVQLPSVAVSIDHVAPTMYDGHDTHLYGVDAYLKWKPVNSATTYASLAWQTEYFIRQLPYFANQLEGVLYSQLVGQVSRRWRLGLRGEVGGIPAGDHVHREYAAGGSVTFVMSEFALARLHGEARFPEGAQNNGAAFLELQVAIGAHGAHAF